MLKKLALAQTAAPMPPRDSADSQVVRFIADPANKKYIKKLGGGPVEVSSGGRNYSKISVFIPNESNDGPAYKTLLGLSFQKNGTWKVEFAKNLDNLPTPGSKISDADALGYVKQIFAQGGYTGA